MTNIPVLTQELAHLSEALTNLVQGNSESQARIKSYFEDLRKTIEANNQTLISTISMIENQLLAELTEDLTVTNFLLSGKGSTNQVG